MAKKKLGSIVKKVNKYYAVVTVHNAPPPILWTHS